MHSGLMYRNSPQSQIAIVDAQTDGYHMYKSKAAKVVGILQIFLGSSIFAAAIAVFIILEKHGNANARVFCGVGYSGIWAPVFPICAGAFGVHSAKTKATCPIVTTMVFSILSSLFALIVGTGPVAVLYYIFAWNGSTAWNSDLYIVTSCSGVMLICAFTEFIVAIVAAAYCCHGCCQQSRQGMAQNMVVLPYGTQNAENYKPDIN